MKPIRPKPQFSRRDFLKLLVRFALYGSASLAGGSLYATWLEPSWIEVAQVSLKLPRLPAAFSGFRLAQISDIHFGSWMTPERLQTAVDLLVAQAPDAVAITGDFVYGSPAMAQAALEPAREIFASLARRAQVFATMGNHDHWTDVGLVRHFLATTNIRELRNDIFPIKRDGQTLYLCGVDDVWEKHAELDVVRAKLPENACAILLAHEPDFAPQAAATGCFDLQISGHSHGGQVVIPFWGPPLLPYLGQHYPAGLYRVKEMFQYTNRGLGMIRPTLRFNCRPEITLFTFT